MSATTLLILAVILFLLCLSAFFSGSETALTAVRRSRIHQMEVDGDRRARLVARLLARRERLIGGILLGNNLVNILASALATSVLITAVGEAGVAYATIAMTLLVVIFAEVLPKTYAIRHADEMALSVAPILRPIIAVLTPVTRLVELLVIGVFKLVGASGDRRGVMSVADEVRGVIDLYAREGSMRKHYRDMLRSILDLAEVEVGEIMVHRKNMVTIDTTLAPGEIVAEVLDSPYTRIPLWRDDPDNIVGVLHAKDLLQKVSALGDAIDDLDVIGAAAEPWFVPDTTSLADQLAAFRARHAHFALVVDEYGALMGLVTLEDILEEIVGEIADEHDHPTPGVAPQADGSYVVDGSVTIRDLNRDLDWRLPDDAAATVAGLVIHEAKRIPDIGQTFAFHNVRFEVLGRERNRITSLRLAAQALPGRES